MRTMGFLETWIGWIMQCVTTVSYSILVNGAPVGNIQPSKGIRQGNSLSPYLFILCAEVLSAQFYHVESMRLIGGTPTSPRGIRISHLFFADESLLFCKATVQEWGKMSSLMEMYEKASEQRLNKTKLRYFSVEIPPRQFVRKCYVWWGSQLLNAMTRTWGCQH